MNTQLASAVAQQEIDLPPVVKVFYVLIDKQQARVRAIDHEIDALINQPCNEKLSVCTKRKKLANRERAWSALQAQKALAEASLLDANIALADALKVGAV